MDLEGILEQEDRKPTKVGATLARLGKYFGSYAFVLLLVAGLIVATTWAQVAAPELIGQATDCFISPAIAQTAADTQAAGAVGIPGMEDFAKQMGGSDSASQTNCWYADLGANRQQRI